MAKKRRKQKRAARDGRNSSNGVNLGFEATLWAAADILVIDGYQLLLISLTQRPTP